MPLSLCRAALAIATLTALAGTAGAQTTRHNVSGDSVAIYNLVGDIRIEGGTGKAVTVEVIRQGRDAEQLKVESGPIRGRESLRVIYPDDDIVMPSSGGGWWNTELRVREDGTFGDGGRGYPRTGRSIRIKSRGDGVEASANLRITVPRGQKIAVYVGVGRAAVRLRLRRPLRLEVADEGRGFDPRDAAGAGLGPVPKRARQ